jgi:hypothetical protein
MAGGSLVFGPGAYLAWVRQFGQPTRQGHYMDASIWGVLARRCEVFRAYAPFVHAPHLVLPAWSVAALAVRAVTAWHITRD